MLLADKLLVEVYDSPADWAAKKRRLSNDSAQPGMFNPQVTPYLLDAYKAFIDPDIRKITIMCGSQMGKTDFLLNLAGYCLDVDPKIIMFVEPTQKLAESISSDRFKKMANSVGLRPEGKPKICEKHYNGTKVMFAWASSASQLCSHPVCVILMDERDQMLSNVDGQGDPYTLAEARTATFPNSKIVCTSTPTLKGSSPISHLWNSSHAFKWSIPCPSCGRFFIPCFELFHYKEVKGVCTDAWLVCTECKKEVRTIDNLHGRFRNVLEANKEHVGYWISGLVSPFRTLIKTGQKYIDALKENEQTVKTCMNTVFGEMYEEHGEKIDVSFLEDAKAECTVKLDYLTMGVDVQLDCLYYAIRGWKDGMSWMTKVDFLAGDTDCENIWAMLASIIDKYQPKLTCVDAGYRTNFVHAFCDSKRGLVVPVKGSTKVTSIIYPRDRDTKYSNGKFVSNAKIFHFDDSYFKSLMFSNLKNKKMFISPQVDQQYLDHMTAEENIFKDGKYVWRQIKKDNHYLDCEKLTLVATEILKRFAAPTVQPKQAVINKGINPYE